MNTPLRIGITIGLREQGESLWNNGIKQNAVYLLMALRHCPNVSSVVLLNTTHIAITDALAWDRKQFPTYSFDEHKDQLDILIELGGQISADQTAYLKQRGVHLISYCCGVEYINAMQSMLFGRTLWGDNLFINSRYDAIWMVPQVARSSQPYFEVLRRVPAHTIPFVWSPIFLEQRTAELPHGGRYHSRERNSPTQASTTGKRLVVMEPNHDVVKFCLYPVLIAESVYRKQPESIEQLTVTNALPMARESMEFITLMNQLDIVREHKAVFLGRFDTPTFLAEHADVVLSHQWENPLNYFYLEVCWQGYPLIHNAQLCSDLGYYYPENDIETGAKLASQAIEQHDHIHDNYIADQRHAIARFLPENSDVVSAYTNLLEQVRQHPPR